MIFVVKQLTSTIPYNNYYVLQVFLIAIVQFILFSKIAKLTHDAKRLTNEKTIEKLERVEEGVIMKKREIRKEVEESNYETRRKKRMIVFNLKEKRRNDW